MDTLHRIADQYDESADRLGTAAQRVVRIDPPATAFGIDAPGRLSDVGCALREQWLAAIGERQREAARLAARLSDVATALRAAATGYAEADVAAARRTAMEA